MPKTSVDWFHQMTNTLLAVLTAVAGFDFSVFLDKTTALKLASAVALAKLIVGAIRTSDGEGS